jgi:hypothetical protein
MFRLTIPLLKKKKFKNTKVILPVAGSTTRAKVRAISASVAELKNL